MGRHLLEMAGRGTFRRRIRFAPSKANRGLTGKNSCHFLWCTFRPIFRLRVGDTLSVPMLTPAGLAKVWGGVFAPEKRRIQRTGRMPVVPSLVQSSYPQGSYSIYFHITPARPQLGSMSAGFRWLWLHPAGGLRVVDRSGRVCFGWYLLWGWQRGSPVLDSIWHLGAWATK